MAFLKKIAFLLLIRLHRICRHLPSIGIFKPLRGGFCGYEGVQSGRLSGEVLHASQNPGVCPEGSMTKIVGWNQHDHQPWPIFWVRDDNARLVGRMMHWRDASDRICKEGVYHRVDRIRIGEDKLFAQILVPKPTNLDGAWTSLLSNWSYGQNYFHWFLDSLTRLYVRQHLPEATRILIPTKPPRFVTETLEILGLLDLCSSPPSECVKPERFYFCSPLSMTGVWNPLGCDWLRKGFHHCYNDERTGNPLFLTRRGSERVPDNIRQIEDFFSQKGFDVIECGDYSVREQIALASSAPAIAGLHGAAMTNLLWARPGTKVLELFGKEYPHACYEQIAFQGRLQYSYAYNAPSCADQIGRWIQSLPDP